MINLAQVHFYGVSDLYCYVIQQKLHLSEVIDVLQQLKVESENSPAEIFDSVYLAADEFVIDQAIIPFKSITLIARSIIIDQTLLPLNITNLFKGRTGYFEMYGGQCSVDNIAFVSDGVQIWESNVPQSNRFLFQIGHFSGKLVHEVHVSVDMIAPLLRNPHFVKCMRLNFDAACQQVFLLPTKENGFKMLDWILSNSLISGEQAHMFKADYKEIVKQVSSILLSQSTNNSIIPVDHLSLDVYQENLKRLIGICEAYEEKLEFIRIQEFLELQSEEFSHIFYENTGEEIIALRTSITQVMNEISEQQITYNELQNDFSWSISQVEKFKELLDWEIETNQIWDDFLLPFRVFQSVLEIASTVASLIESPNQVGKVNSLIENSGSIIQELVDHDYGGAQKLGTVSKQLVKMQQHLSEEIIFVHQVQEDKTTPEQVIEHLDHFDWAVIASIDPVTEWQRFSEGVKDGLYPLVNELKYASDYLKALKDVARYGEAINSKAIEIARLNMRLLELKSQRVSLENIRDRWGAALDNYVNDREVKAILTSLVQQQYANVRRDLIILYMTYRNVYYYNWLSFPEAGITMDMDVASLRIQVNRIEGQIQMMQSNSQPGQAFDSGEIMLRLGNEQEGEGTNELAIDTNHRKLVFTVDLSESILTSFLPNRSVLVFVEEAAFFLEYQKNKAPKSETQINLRVSTSGHYRNGYTASVSPHFVTEPRALDFIYSQAEDEVINVITPWKPADQLSSNFMLPTLFTNWSVKFDDTINPEDLKGLKVRFKGYYINNLL